MRVEELIAIFEGLKTKYNAVFNPPATKEEIEFAERRLYLAMPEDVKELYRICDGFDTDEMMFRVVPLSEAIQYRKELKKGQFYFAEYMIYSDSWIVDVREKPYAIRNDEQTRKKFTSVATFLSAFLEGGVEGLYEKKTEGRA